MQSHQGGDAAIVLAQRDSETVQTGYAVHVVTGGGYTSRLTLVNSASIQQQLQLTLNGTTVQRTIPANGRLDESLADMFQSLEREHIHGISKGGSAIQCAWRKRVC